MSTYAAILVLPYSFFYKHSILYIHRVCHDLTFADFIFMVTFNMVLCFLYVEAICNLDHYIYYPLYPIYQ